MRTLLIITTLMLFTASISTAQDNDTNPLMQKQTIKNLQKAYEDEINNAHKYELFAMKAKAEGFEQAADAFAAAAVAEGVHSINHEKAITALGCSAPKPQIKDVAVNSTKENLEKSINEEGKEEQVNYPAFIEEAKKENAPEATQSFTYAMRAEGDHKTLLKDALDHLCQTSTDNYYVNDETGETVKLPQTAPPPQTDGNDSFMEIDI